MKLSMYRGVHTLLSFILLCLSGSSFPLAAQAIVISTGELPPRYSTHLPYKGIMPRLITEAFRLEGVKARFEFYPWQRALMLAKEGRVHATALWGYKAERNQYFYHSDPVHYSRWVFFHLRGTNINWSHFSDLKGYDVAAVSGFYLRTRIS